LVILSLTWRRLTRNGALAGIVVGAATVLFWIYAPVLEGPPRPAHLELDRL
jgi:SSS family solute:Na+ symporter/sodium/proline symporter